MTQPAEHAPDFYNLGIAPKLLEALDRNKYTTPTPIQQKSIPIALEGKDLMGIAQTGTGKTLAFGIPMIQRLAVVKGRGLIILPTRELALQVEETIMKIGRSIGIRTAVLIGGTSMQPQISALARNPHVIVATPGRLIDHLNQRTVRLNDVTVLVLDEADRMLDMGFAPQIQRILTSVPKDRQTMLFSATMPQEIVRIAAGYMKLPVRVEIARAGTMAELVTQELFVVRKDQKNRLLEKLLGEYRGTMLVFSRTKHGAKRIAAAVRAMGHTGAEIHSNRSLSQRREALEGFKSGKYRVLIATDIAARGIDVKGIEVVLNYDLPDNPDDYVHRIGRTGRAGHEGHAISFATPDQGRDVREIERLTRKILPVTPTPKDLPVERPQPMHEAEPSRFQGRGSRPSYGGSRRSEGEHRQRTRSYGAHASFGGGSSAGKETPRAAQSSYAAQGRSPRPSGSGFGGGSRRPSSGRSQGPRRAY